MAGTFTCDDLYDLYQKIKEEIRFTTDILKLN